MKIIGNGVDIVENKRIKISLKNPKFMKRIYTKTEIINSLKIKNPSGYFAKRFAAKEAFVKALGTGFTKRINFKDIEIHSDKHGKPIIKVSKKVKNIIKLKHKVKNYDIYLSLSDEKKYSIAFVIITKIHD